MAPLPPGFVLDKPTSEGPWTKYGKSKDRPVRLPPGFVVVRRGDGTVPPLPEGFALDQPPNTAELYAKPNIDPALNVPAGDGYQGALQAASNASLKKGGPGPEMRAPEDNPFRALEIALQGDRQSLADIPGSVVDLTNMGMNLALMGADGIADTLGNPMGVDVPVRMSNRPAFGSDFLGDAIESVIPGEPYKPEEMTPMQRSGYEGNRSAVTAFFPAVALNKMAIRGTAQALKSPLLEGFTRNTAPLSDTIAATGAGAMYGAYESRVPEDVKEKLGPIGGIIASLAGASGANAIENFARGGFRGVGTGIDRLLTGGVDTSLPPTADGRFVKVKDADLAALLVQQRAANPGLAAETIKQKVDDLAPYAGKGSLPTSGILSDDPGLVALEKAQRQSPELFTDFATRDQATERAALANSARIAPENASGRQFTDTIEQQHNARVEAARGELDYNTGRQEQLDAIMAQRAANVAAAQGTKPLASQRLDDVVAPTLTAAQRAKNDAFAAIDPEGTVQRPIDPLLQAADDIDARTGPLADPAGRPQAMMERIRGLADEETGTGTISFQDLNAARIDLAGQIASARKSGNYALADNLATIRGTINADAERLARDGGEAGVRAQQAMQEYQRFAEVWNRGPGDPATKFRQDFNFDRQNRSEAVPSDTAERFLQRGSPEKVESLRRIIGDSPEGTQAAGDFLAADLAEARGVVLNGRVNPAAVRKWMASWGPAIDLSPSFRRQIDELLRSSDMDAADATILGHQLREAATNLETQQRDTAAIRKVLGNDPANAVAAIFRSGDPERVVKEIKAHIEGNESATNGLKAAVREYLVDRATTSGLSRTGDGTNPLSFASLDDLFKQNEGVLAEIFTPDDMNYLRASHQLLAPLKNLEMRTIPGSQTSSNDRMWDSIAKPLEVGLKLRFGVLKGGGLMRTLNLWRQLLPNGDKAAKQLIGQMYFNPDLARHLLTRKVRLVGTAGYNKQLIRLLIAGQVSREKMQGWEEDKNEPIEITVGGNRGAFAPQ